MLKKIKIILSTILAILLGTQLAAAPKGKTEEVIFVLLISDGDSKNSPIIATENPKKRKFYMEDWKEVD